MAAKTGDNVRPEGRGDKIRLPAAYTEAKTRLAQMVAKDEVKDWIDKAAAMATYAFQAKDPELIQQATEVRRRAERRLGELIEEDRKAGKLAKGGGDQKSDHRGSENPSDKPTLAEQGIDKNLAKRARAAAKMTEDDFEEDLGNRKILTEAAVIGKTEVVTAARQAIAAEKRKNRAEKEAKLSRKITALPDKRYGVILADPEWQFEFYAESGKDIGSPDNHYPTSSIDEIKARDVPSVAANDCILFLWATAPLLPQQIEVMQAWDFEYKTHLIWVKDKAGIGFWFRNKHEILLVGTKGKVPAPAPGDNWQSVIEAPRRAHSQKPEIIYALIEAYFPSLPKLEMNARQNREGWDAWGNEIALGPIMRAAG
jgi:N6-adenosine-specific RNA methylase IME4